MLWAATDDNDGFSQNDDGLPFVLDGIQIVWNFMKFIDMVLSTSMSEWVSECVCVWVVSVVFTYIQIEMRFVCLVLCTWYT